VFESGIGNRVLPRASRRHEGVDCISCHLLPSGEVAGSIDNPSAPCRPTIRRELQRTDFCAVCHDQHKTVQQWLTTSYVDKKQDCLHCHMPFRDGDPNRGRDHTMIGGHDIDLVRSAVELRGEAADGVWKIEVENVAAGHHYPTDERSRASDVFWRPLAEGAEEGEGRWYFLYRIRDPYRFETDLPRTLIAHGETREIVLDHPDAKGGAEVGLFYNLRPVYVDRVTAETLPIEDVLDPRPDAQLVHRVLLRP
ncbi:MAG: putative CXXCH cytochrome family protein, partial [Planctomycetota bacterium]